MSIPDPQARHQAKEVASQKDLFTELKGGFAPADRLAIHRAEKSGKIHRVPGPKPKDVYYKRAEFREWISTTKYAKHLSPEGAKLPHVTNEETVAGPPPPSVDVDDVVALSEIPELAALPEATVLDFEVDDRRYPVPVGENPALLAEITEAENLKVSLSNLSAEQIIETATSHADEPPCLSADEADFRKLDAVVRQGLRKFIEVGQALKNIHDRKLYLAGGYKSWEDCCRTYGDMTKSYASRLMFAAEVAVRISDALPIGNLLPNAESQVRPLALLDDPAQQDEAWGEAVELAGGGQPTGKLVAQVVAKKKGVPDVQPPTIPEPEPETEIARSFNQILEAVRAELSHQEIEVLLVDFGKLIGVSQPTSNNQP